MPMPIKYNVGDKVIITADNLKIMQDSNRSTLHPLFPSDSFIEKARKCVAPDGHVGLIGEVTHTFPPGYEVTARFKDDLAFHMKDHWITRLTADMLRADIRGKLIAENATSLDDAELSRVFDGAVCRDFCIDQVRRVRDAIGITMQDILDLEAPTDEVRHGFS